MTFYCISLLLYALLHFILLNFPIFRICTLSGIFRFLKIFDANLGTMLEIRIFVPLHEIARNTSQDLDIANDGYDEE